MQIPARQGKSANSSPSLACLPAPIFDPFIHKRAYGLLLFALKYPCLSDLLPVPFPFRLFALCSFPPSPFPHFPSHFSSTRQSQSQSVVLKHKAAIGRRKGGDSHILPHSCCSLPTLHCIYIHIRFAFVASNTNIERRDRGMCRERQRETVD